jgi:hypothetical protein
VQEALLSRWTSITEMRNIITHGGENKSFVRGEDSKAMRKSGERKVKEVKLDKSKSRVLRQEAYPSSCG